MDRQALLRKVDNDKGLTVEEIIEYHAVGKHWAKNCRNICEYINLYM
jgi:hypothetical protein